MRWRTWLLGSFLCVVLGTAGFWWARGGAQVDLFLGAGAVMAPGETLYFGVLPVATADATLTGSRIATIDPSAPEGITLDVIAVRQGPGDPGIGSQHDIAGLERVDFSSMEIQVVDSPSAEPPIDWLVVEVTAEHEGVWRIAELEASYRSGWHPTRTATSVGELCILVTDAPEAFVRPSDHNGGTPEGIDPVHYRRYLECTGHEQAF